MTQEPDNVRALHAVPDDDEDPAELWRRYRGAVERGELIYSEPPQRPIRELKDSGVLWAVNRVLFHPRGHALCLHTSRGEVTGWSIAGDGSEPWKYLSDTDEDQRFTAFEETLLLAAVRTVQPPPP